MRYAYCRGELPQGGSLWTTHSTSRNGTVCGDECGDCLDWLVSGSGFQSEGQIRTLAINYLLSDARSQDGDVNPCDPSDRRGWWATTCRDDGFELGSRLWLLENSRLNDETVLIAREYAEEALGRLVDNGLAERIVVDVEICGCNELKLTATVYVNGGPIVASVIGELNPGYGYLWRELN